MKNSAINWTNHTFNPWIGCTKVSAGCANCYAEREMDKRRHVVEWGEGRPRHRTSLSYWKEPLKWNREPFVGRQRVFCASLADWLDQEVPEDWRRDLLSLIVATPNLDWLLLTKRPQFWQHGILPANVWYGVSTENQPAYDERARLLSNVVCKVKFISCEPMLGPISIIPFDSINWVICGGESGPKARPMQEIWARDLLRDCHAANLAFWMKQLGGWPNTRHELTDLPEDLRVRELP
jgi:protein gp37